MAYFDSAKNRALWQEELKGLTAERERRKRGEKPGREVGGDAVKESSPPVQKITFRELLAEQEKAAGRKPGAVYSSEAPETEKTDDPIREHKKSL